MVSLGAAVKSCSKPSPRKQQACAAAGWRVACVVDGLIRVPVPCRLPLEEQKLVV